MTYFENHDLPPPHLINVPVDSSGNTLLHKMCQNSATTAKDIERMVRAGADINATNDDHQPPLSTAINANRTDLVEGFIQAGAKTFFQATPDRHFNAIFLAVYNQKFDILKTLLNSSAALEGLNRSGMNAHGYEDGMYPLHLAAKNEFSLAVQALLNAGALIDQQCETSEKYTALHLTIECKSYHACRVLLKNGADIEKPSYHTAQRALHVAAQTGNSEVAKYLIKYGADIHATTKSGKTPLHYAANEDNSRKTKIAKALLKNGANINAKDNEGTTPLMYAAKVSNLSLVNYLLSHNADPLLSNIFNKTAYNFAIDSNAAYSEHNAVKRKIREAEEQAHNDKCQSGYRRHKNKKPGMGGAK